MDKGFQSMIEGLQAKKGVMLKTQFDMFMPMAQAMLAAQARAKGTEQAHPDAQAPFMEMSMEVEVISGAPIDDSVFAVPRNYQIVSVTELLKSFMPASQTAEAAAAATSTSAGAAKAETAPQN
jgi:hypothetical protein